MTFYHPRDILNWPQVLLNGIIRPKRFFSHSPWKGNLFESFLVLSVSLGVHFSLISIVFNSFTLFESSVLAFTTSVFLFALVSLLYFLSKVQFLKLYGGISNFFSALSYLSVCHLLLAPVIFSSTEAYQATQLYLIAWGILGMIYGFIGVEGIKSLQTVGVYSLIVITCTMIFYSQSLQRAKTTSLLDKPGQMSLTEEMIPQKSKDLFSYYTKLADFEVGEKYHYNFSYYEKGKNKTGRLILKVREVSLKRGVVQVDVEGFFDGKVLRFPHTIYTNQQGQDYSFLMKSQKPNIKTAMRLLTTSLVSVHKLKYMRQFQPLVKKSKRIRVNKVKGSSGVSHKFTNIPSLLSDVLIHEQDKSVDMVLNKKSALPLKLTGALKHGTKYNIKLIKRSRY